MLSGRTSKNKYKEDISSIENDFKIILNNSKEKKIVRYSDYINLDELREIKFYRSGETSIVLGESDRNILRIAFHWKNKFQGCQTPCLNVFFCL